MDDTKDSAKDTQRKGCDPQTARRGDPRQEKETPYKTEPDLKNISGIIEEFHKTANRFIIGELPCPVLPEVE